MIRINDVEFKQNHYPDGTALLTFDNVALLDNNKIVWNYENDAELFTLICIAGHIGDLGLNAHLYMPYMPHARMDRVKRNQDVFTLKYFCEVINNCNFDRVYVLDPHSSVSEALIDRLTIFDPFSYVYRVVDMIENKEEEAPIIFYPDEGSMKRYSGSINRKYTFGVKKRDWKTGNIEGLDVIGEHDSVKGKNVLIVDDICSRGGTFYHSAKKLKELGANKIYLYVTHCENTIFEGELLTSGLIEKIYTTNSIYTGTCKMIEVLNI